MPHNKLNNEKYQPTGRSQTHDLPKEKMQSGSMPKSSGTYRKGEFPIDRRATKTTAYY